MLKDATQQDYEGCLALCISAFGSVISKAMFEISVNGLKKADPLEYKIRSALADRRRQWRRSQDFLFRLLPTVPWRIICTPIVLLVHIATQ